MVVSRQVELLLYRGIGRQCGWGFDALAQVIGRAAIPFLRTYLVPAKKRMVADLLEFAAPEISDVVSGRTKFKSLAKSVRRQTLGKQLGGGSRKRSASRVIPTKSTKQISRSRRDNFKNIFHSSCRVIFVTNFLWQFLGILEGRS